MKHFKTLGLLAVAVAALMAFASSASASILTGPETGATATSLTAEAGATSLDGAFTTVTCNKSHVAATIKSQGSGQTIQGNITSLTFNECNFPVTVEKLGTIEAHAIKPQGQHETCETGNDFCWATLTSSGADVKIITSVGTCGFTTSSTSFGVLTTSSATLGTAKIDIAGKIPRTYGSFLCGSTGTWTGSYSVTSPDKLWIDE